MEQANDSFESYSRFWKVSEAEILSIPAEDFQAPYMLEDEALISALGLTKEGETASFLLNNHVVRTDSLRDYIEFEKDISSDVVLKIIFGNLKGKSLEGGVVQFSLSPEGDQVIVKIEGYHNVPHLDRIGFEVVMDASKATEPEGVFLTIRVDPTLSVTRSFQDFHGQKVHNGDQHQKLYPRAAWSVLEVPEFDIVKLMLNGQDHVDFEWDNGMIRRGVPENLYDARYFPISGREDLFFVMYSHRGEDMTGATARLCESPDGVLVIFEYGFDGAPAGCGWFATIPNTVFYHD